MAVALPAFIIAASLADAVCAAPVLPSGGSVQAGSATIQSPMGGRLTIDQTSAKAVINWSSFSIGSGGQVQFDNGAGVTLNRVTGGSLTQINGVLSATGGVYVLNPNGVIVGKSGVVNVGGAFVASTLDMTDGQFMRGGDLSFAGASSASVSNSGLIISSAGDVALIAAQVTNDGQIQAPGGDAALAAGHQVVLRSQAGDDGKLTVLIGGPGTSVTNTGLIQAADAELRANGGDIYALAVNTGEGIEATGVAARDGNVYLVADGGSVTARGDIAATRSDGSGGFVETSGATVDFTGLTVHAANWLIDPVNLAVDSAAAATISTNLATTNVTLQTTASSASGPGNQSAGAGDITIGAPISWSSANTLTLDAFHSISIDAAVTASGPGKVVLTTNDGGTGGDYDFGLGPSGFAGSLSFTGTPNSGQALTINGQAYTLLYKLTDSLAPTGNGPDSGTDDIAGIDNNAAAGGDAGSYALAVNVAGTGTTAAPQFSNGLVANGPNFTGSFEGLGHAVTDLTISSNSLFVGLFDTTGGVVRDLGLVGGSVTSTGGADGVGDLTGANISSGAVATIENSFATGAVSGGSTDGGLAGFNNATVGTTVNIINSYATGSVSSASGPAGGLVGQNVGNAGGSANISNSQATGVVTTGSGGAAGGLVGLNNGSGGAANISNSSAGGPASGGQNTTVGGLVGDNQAVSGGVASVANGSASGAVSAGQNADEGGLVGENVANNGVASLTNVSATGAVSDSATLAAVGGLVGSNAAQTGGSALISHATATGAISAPAASFAGGLVGFNQGGNGTASIDTSAATGAVTDASSQGVVGGLVGMNEAVGGGSSNISNSTAAGAVNGGGAGGPNPQTLVGGLVGQNFATGSGSAANIGNSSASGPVTGDLVNSVGGLVGFNDAFVGTANITGSTASGSVQGVGSGWIGGLVGDNSGSGAGAANLTNVRATGAVSGSPSGTQSGVTGGLAGGNIGNGGAANIVNAYATGAVSDTGVGIAGGLVGENEIASTGSATISDTFATGSVTGTDWAGGLVGINNGAIADSYATGAINSQGTAGGLVGTQNADTGQTASITNAYAMGSVSGGGPTAQVGGLVGGEQLSGGTDSISNSYATGFVSGGGPTTAGGLVGEVDGTGGGSAPVTSSYWNVTTSGQTTDGAFGSTGLTTAQLQGALPAGFSNSVWGTGTGLYPYLTSIFPTVPQAISGFAFSANGVAAAGAQVSVYAAQAVLSGGAASSGADGYFYEIVPSGTVTASTKLAEHLTLSGAFAATGVTYTDQPVLTAGNVDNFNITSGVVQYTTAEASMSAAAVDENTVVPPNALVGFSDVIWLIRATNAGGFTVDTLNSPVAGLTVDSTQGITFTQALSITGAGQVVLKTNDGGSGGDYAFQGAGALTFTGAPNTGQSLTINGQAYSLIYSEADLLNANNNLAGDYALATPLDFSNFEFTDAPVASNTSTQFTGVFTGLGNSISNLYVNDTIPLPQTLFQFPSHGFVGLFGLIGAGGVVRDLTLSNATVVGGDEMDVGALAGGVAGGTVRNDSSSGQVTVGNALAANEEGNAPAGGLVGFVSQGGVVANSSSSAQVTGGDAFAGGLVGAAASGATITGSHASGNVSVTASTSFEAAIGGGLFGVVDGYQFGAVNPTLVSIANDYATGNVTGGAGSVLGGFSGYADQAQITASYATGTVTQTAPGIAGVEYDFAGGFLGVDQEGVAITQSYASGAVTTVGGPNNWYTDAGGFIGDEDINATNTTSTITNSYALGSVTATGSAFSLIGGFAGAVRGGASANDVYATGAVSGPGVVGGLVGLVGDAGDTLNTGGSISNGYWDQGTTGAAVGFNLYGTGTASNIVAVGGSTGVNPYAAATYASLDLAGTWFIIDGQTRPILRSEYSTNIVNAHQLQLMALNLAANYTLGADIDASETSRAAGVWNLANGFSPIGPAFPSASFTGSLDGQGHTVSNLTIIDATPALQTSSVVDANGYVGLFGVIGAGATVQNINLANARITGGDGMAVGALAGIVRGTVNNASSSGLVADGNSLADNDLNRPASAQFAVALAGGLVGDAEFSGSITNSSSSATVTAGNGAAAGGLAGALLYGASASSVSATGNVAVGAGTTFVASSAGGLAGSIDGFPAGEVNPIQVTVTGSHAAGNVSGGLGSFDAGFAGEVQQGEVANSFATGNASGGGGSLVGGFAADVYQGQVSNSYATGNVAALTPPPAGPGTGSGGSTPAGGGGSVFESIVGGFAAVVDNGGLVTGSYSSGAVTTAAPVSANSITLAGGFVGYVNVSGSVSESYSLGSVATTGPAAPAGDVAVTGGFAGDVAGSFGNVYATGATLSATSPVTDFTGGLIGFLSGAVTTGYWDEGTTGQVSAIGLSSGTATNLIGVGGATGLNPYAAATYANFDFAGAWFIIDGETRPILRAEYSTNITDAHQLELMSLNLSGFYTLGGNIDASETSSATGVWNPANGFVPVGALATTPFNGLLLGNGDTIANLTIIDTTPVAQTLPSGVVSNGAVGLFGFDAGSVDEINLANVSVTAGPGMAAGAYAGSLTGALSFVTVSSGAVTTGGGSPSGLPEAGGLVGDFGDLNGNGLIINSGSAATVTGGTDANVGGLVGIAHATITASNASGNVTVGSTGTGGGLVGEAEGPQGRPAGISASFATGNVTGAADTDIGGFAGVIFNATLSQDYATGTVAQAAGGPNGGQANEAGGFVGVFDAGSISQSFASGAVSTVAGGAGAGAGGFVGDDSGTITDSYATGAVTMSGGGQSLGAGGFAGTIEAAGSLVRVLATGPVSGPGPAGGVAGAVTNGGQIASSYWDEGTTGQTNAAGQGAGVGATGIGGATGISPFAEATYAGFDFTNTWSAPSAGFYPELFGVSHVLRVTGGDTTSVYGSFPILTDSIFGQQANPTGFGMSGLTWTLLGLTTSTSGFFNVGAYGLALSGANASDFSGAYRVVYVNGQLTVTPKPLAGLLTGVVQKTYDGTTNATLSAGDFNGLSGVIAGDIVSLNASVTGTYATQNVGSGIVVTATGVSLTGADAQDYTIGGSVSGPVGVITPATLTASLSGTVEKTYDGTTAATLTPGDYALSGAVAGDDVGLNDPTAGAYATQNVGAGIVVTATGLSLTGTTAQDYTVNNSVSAPVGVIDPKTLAVALTGTVEKTYDGTTAATLAPGDFTLLGVVDGDDVGVSGSSSGTYATQNAGTGIVVTATGVSLTGTAAQNYTIGAGPNGLDPNGLDSNGGGQNGIGVSGPVGVIDPKTLTVSLTGTVEKTFDGTTTATLSPNNYVLSGGVIGSDAVSLNDPTTGTYDSSAVGVGKPVTVDNLTLTGSNASDYHVNMTAVGNIGVIDAAAAASIIQVQVVTSPPDGALTEDLVVPLTPPATTGQGSGPGAADVFVAPFTVFPVVQDQSAAAFGQALPITGAGNGDLWVGSDLDEKDKR